MKREEEEKKKKEKLPITYPVLLNCLFLLLLPHAYDERQIRVVKLGALKLLQRVHQNLAHVVVLCALEQRPRRVDKLGVHAPRKRFARVVGQDPHQHDGVVLP